MIVLFYKLAFLVAHSPKHAPSLYVGRIFLREETLPNLPRHLGEAAVFASIFIPFHLGAAPIFLHPLLKFVLTNFVFAICFHMRKSTTGQSPFHSVNVTFHA